MKLAEKIEKKVVQQKTNTKLILLT